MISVELTTYAQMRRWGAGLPASHLQQTSRFFAQWQKTFLNMPLLSQVFRASCLGLYNSKLASILFHVQIDQTSRAFGASR
jgi:hypothetical protein